jgi:hypothetical protein
MRSLHIAATGMLAHARHHPAPEALEHAVPITKITRQVAPWQARSDPPQNGFKEKPVVASGHPAIRGFAR